MNLNTSKLWIEEIQKISPQKIIKIMNVCGGHERVISHAGIRDVIPENIELIPGPGCPVCVCPEEDIHWAIQVSLQKNTILVSFGDMLRVPINAPKSRPRSLLEARCLGADVRAVSSPQEAINIAKQSKKDVVFFACGFETTTAPLASMLLEGVPENLYILLSARLTWPAVASLLQTKESNFDALIAPGHVSAIMGIQDWDFLPNDFNIPVAISGFTVESMLESVCSVLKQLSDNVARVDNCYSSVVRASGNLLAKEYIKRTMDICDATWRGFGQIEKSGLKLKREILAQDARIRFDVDKNIKKPEEWQGMPTGCECADVIKGKVYPNHCKLYGRVCTPKNAVGPCMVSDEGACRIWWHTRS